jgi:hypothetical protein
MEVIFSAVMCVSMYDVFGFMNTTAIPFGINKIERQLMILQSGRWFVFIHKDMERNAGFFCSFCR